MTGKCVRQQFEKSPITWQSVDWKLVTLYIKLHENYWKCNELSEVKKFLPERISNIGRPPSIGTLGVESRYKWSSQLEILSNQTARKLMGFAMEIAVIFFFRNFTYTFGGDIFVQMFGGPIGARITMAVAKLVMQQWKNDYDKILERSGIQEWLSGLYVDDGRSYQRKLKWGERYCGQQKKFTFDVDKEMEDASENVDRNELTRREVLLAMNDVNKDLEFTKELCSDFIDKKLPTLSFSLNITDEGIQHTYFEKNMKNQTLVVERSALGRQQLMSIMTNELRRRLEVIGDSLSQKERNEIVDKYTQQLVNSEFNWKQCRDIVVSGLKGQKRKTEKQRKKGQPKYRSGQSSLATRVEKKLLEKYNWFRTRKPESDSEEVTENESVKLYKRKKWLHYKRKKEPIMALEKEEIERKENPPKAVLFVPNTVNSVLANEIRETVQSLRPWTGLNLKIVERAGEKLQDVLCKSNPWDNIDCKREECFTCEGGTKYERCKFKNCRQRSVLYETWCETCRKKDLEEDRAEKKEEENEKNGGRKRNREKEKEEEIYRYIGETSRSTFERGSEHRKDLKYRRTTSHLLRHCVEVHENVDPDTVEFGMRMISAHRTAFERQLAEAVMIEKYTGPYLLNSKLEYSRCNIPKMTLRLGDIDEKIDPQKEKERSTKEKIKSK